MAIYADTKADIIIDSPYASNPHLEISVKMLELAETARDGLNLIDLCLKCGSQKISLNILYDFSEAIATINKAIGKSPFPIEKNLLENMFDELQDSLLQVTDYIDSEEWHKVRLYVQFQLIPQYISWKEHLECCLRPQLL